MNWLRQINFNLIGVKRFLHHSSTQGRYYTNRFYIKKCNKCLSINSLTLVKCFNCSNTLTDSDIRLRNLDHVCEVSNTRKKLIDIVNENNKINNTYDDNNFNNSNINNFTINNNSSNIYKSGYINNSLILYRCFDFTIMLNPRPSSFIHLSAFPNGTFYDIKNFRKSHIPMIIKMNNKCLDIFKDIFESKIDLEIKINDFIYNNKLHNNVNLELEDKLSKDQRKYILTEQMKIIKKELGMDSDDKSKLDIVYKSIFFGFNYPNKHSHVDMHAILPPINNYNIFKTPFYYPLDKIISDLTNFGQVRQYSPIQIRKMNEFDEILDNVKQIDKNFREYFCL